MHIGSQITDLEPLGNAFALMAELVGMLRDSGHSIDFVNAGGGLGVPYHDDMPPPPRPELYAQTVREKLAALDCKILFEPGRMIAANAGILVSRVIYGKEAGGKRFIIADGAMNDLIRPTLYDAWHEVWPIEQAKTSQPRQTVDLVGPICESSDYFAKDRPLPPLDRGDLFAIMTAGAYGAVQSSTYNTRLPVPEVLVNGAKWAVVRQRPDYDALLKAESLAPWLQADEIS
jgi:diaminopimelate decarboxylase